jgi:hypothetical protein
MSLKLYRQTCKFNGLLPVTGNARCSRCCTAARGRVAHQLKKQYVADWYTVCSSLEKRPAEPGKLPENFAWAIDKGVGGQPEVPVVYNFPAKSLSAPPATGSGTAASASSSRLGFLKRRVEILKVIRKTTLSKLAVAALCIGGGATANVAQAFDLGNVMNPSRWFDNDRDRGYYRGYGPYYGGYGPYGYGGPYGGYGGPYGPWGGYPGGYGWGGYPGGYGGYGGYPSTIVVNPTQGQQSNQPPPPRLPE